MTWQERMNETMTYIENNLRASIEGDQMAKIMQCSEWEWRRLFSFLTHMSLSEYIRGRRMTKAAEDIQGGKKIMTVALDYGYESHGSFTRAFKNTHGIAPSVMKKSGGGLKSFPPLTFALQVKEGDDIKETCGKSVSIIGGGEPAYASLIALDEEKIKALNEMFWSNFGNDVVGTTALPKYGAFVSEDKC